MLGLVLRVLHRSVRCMRLICEFPFFFFPFLVFPARRKCEGYTNTDLCSPAHSPLTPTSLTLVRHIYFLIQRPLTSFLPAHSNTPTKDQHLPQSHIPPPSLLSPSWLIFIAPLSSIKTKRPIPEKITWDTDTDITNHCREENIPQINHNRKNDPNNSNHNRVVPNQTSGSKPTGKNKSEPENDSRTYGSENSRTTTLHTAPVASGRTTGRSAEFQFSFGGVVPAFEFSRKPGGVAGEAVGNGEWLSAERVPLPVARHGDTSDGVVVNGLEGSFSRDHGEKGERGRRAKDWKEWTSVLKEHQAKDVQRWKEIRELMAVGACRVKVRWEIGGKDNPVAVGGRAGKRGRIRRSRLGEGRGLGGGKGGR